MTFNVQLLPVVPIVAPSPGDEAESRASAIMEAFKKLPLDELPDVVTFNECFNEDARKVVINGMSGLYPNHIAKFDDTFVGGDSGLAVYSKYPFFPLDADGKKFLFFSYPDAEDDDALAGKGVAVIRLETPLGMLTLAFTHTQAFYHSEDEYRGTRAKQLADVGKTIAQVNGNFPALPWAKTILMGDLNIIGNHPPDPAANPKLEWDSTFENPGQIMADAFWDGWRHFNRPPGSAIEQDPGFTNNNLEAGENGQLPRGLLSRLDYICFSKLPADQVFVAQHLRTRFRTLSDHWSLEADIHLTSPHCSPSTAFDAALAPVAISHLKLAQLEITRPGAYQWVFVAKPGTYTIFKPTGLEITLYAADNLSTPWNPYGQIDAATMGIDNLEKDVRRFDSLEPTGDQYSMPGPFFIRIRAGSKNPDVQGTCFLGIYEHTGQTPDTAIVIQPWAMPLDAGLPAGQPNGVHDECWFRAEIGRAYSGTEHNSRFIIQNNTGNDAKVKLFRSGFSVISGFSNADPETVVEYSTSGPDTVFIRLNRSTLSDTSFRVSWQSGLTWLRSVPNVRPMVLRCADETGPDWLGADEITLTLYADDHRPEFFSTYWDDADSNEILKLEGQVPEIAFVNYIDVSVNESDFIQSPDDWSRVGALAPTDGLIKAIVQSFDVQSGTYQFECSLSRTQQG
ncbi:endonuclease/exonuclease/phosphatase family protein [Variovorax sp. J22R24]|uniref:endonuclease/exonuclease/phosphatase family protein n=1 Tax=Variovorax gracilis TaxID=3053502 RepID=UPI00257871D1|nr:endonuclease/exonuclease/phosphatase family protein [Variovorax sp. J22R24]MDM0109314.1 endonuclease/exonuclease/phosphatase family protein [Variovorax sp. J22R24]